MSGGGGQWPLELTTEMTESMIIAGCQRGDVNARKALYDLTVDRIYRLLFRMTGNPEDASELAQETYLRAFERIGSFREDSSVTTWLYRIAVNEALQHRRRRQLEQSHLAAEAGARNAAEEPGQLASTRTDIRSALALLDESDRTILLLRYEHGLDYRELAEVLDCVEGTVASRLNRARQKMHGLLADGYSPREEARPLSHPKIWTEVGSKSEDPPNPTRKNASGVLRRQHDWNSQ